jgi:D-aspartate ligase
MSDKITAVVLGADLNGLGVIRSLARGRIPTISLDTTDWHAGSRSRFCRSMTVEKLYGWVLVERIIDLSKRLRTQPALLATNALTVRTISEYRDELRDFCKFRLPSRDTVAMLQDKARLFEFLQQHDLPVPRTVVLKYGDPLDVLSTMPFPAVIKPAET